jgi:hypothetical protein
MSTREGPPPPGWWRPPPPATPTSALFQVVFGAVLLAILIALLIWAVAGPPLENLLEKTEPDIYCSETEQLAGCGD